MDNWAWTFCESAGHQVLEDELRNLSRAVEKAEASQVFAPAHHCLRLGLVRARGSSLSNFTAGVSGSKFGSFPRAAQIAAELLGPGAGEQIG